jgi:hypothetical protein
MIGLESSRLSGCAQTLCIVYVAPLPRAPLTRLHPAFSPFELPVHLSVPRISIRSLKLQAAVASAGWRSLEAGAIADASTAIDRGYKRTLLQLS